VCAGTRTPFERTASAPSKDSSVVPTWISTPRRDLREDLRRRVDEHPALRRLAQVGIPPERVRDEVGELGERLHSRVAGADEDEAEVLSPAPVVLLR
jgi:hypothetical protein